MKLRRPQLAALAALLAVAAMTLTGCGGDGSGPPPPPPNPLSIVTVSVPEGTAGQPYTAGFVATGGTWPYTWSLATGSGPLPDGLTLSNSGLISGTPTKGGLFSFTVQVRDSAARSATKPFTLRILDVLRITTEALAKGIKGQPYTFTLQAAGGTPPYAWSLAPNSWALPAGLTLSSDGTLSGTPTEYSYYFNLIFRVQDSASSMVEKSLPLTIYDVLRITTTALPSGNVGISYGPHYLYAQGGGGGYVWGLAPASGPLPPGLSLSASGRLEGTPTTPGTYDLIIQVTDQGQPSQTATQALSILIENRVIIVGPQPVVGVVGRSYTHTFQAVAGIKPYTWSLLPYGPLPPGLSLDPATGTVSGTPTSQFYSSIRISVTDSSVPPQSYATYYWFNIQPPPYIATSRLNDGVLDRSYYTEVFVSGGLQPYQARIAAGALPPGLSLGSTTPGVRFDIRGTATALGTWNFTLEVTDASSPPYVASKDFSIQVNTPLVFAGIPLPDGLEGNPYSVTFTATGGVPPYRWAAYSLPAGLTMDSATGTLSGTPTEPYNLNVGIIVSDASYPSQQVERSLPLKIIARLVLTTSQLPPVAVARPLRIGLGVRGGTPPFRWSLVSPTSLPSGLSLSTSGEIIGTPSIEESQTFTVRVNDSGISFPQSHEQTLTLNIVSTLGRNDSTATATPLSNGTYEASISPYAHPADSANPDNDYYAVTAEPGTVISVEITAERLPFASVMDSVIEIVDSAGVRYTTCSPSSPNLCYYECLNDDIPYPYTVDSRLYFRVPGTPGTPVTFYVRVLDWSGSARPDFVYRITISGAN